MSSFELSGHIERAIRAANASPTEAYLRSSYPFANVVIQFATRKEAAPVILPAYVKNVDNGFNVGFSTVEVYGRMDPIPVYSGTTRTITLTLGLPVFSEDHGLYLLDQMNTLAKGLYPSYERYGSDTLIINAPPLWRLKFANLICNPVNNKLGLLGYVNGSFNMAHAIEQKGIFVVGRDGQGLLVPKSWELNISFNVLHEQTPGFVDGLFVGGDSFPYGEDGREAKRRASRAADIKADSFEVSTLASDGKTVIKTPTKRHQKSFSEAEAKEILGI